MSNYIHLRDKGFTLVELAIALMVIGLLIGGVLKGQELIENAKITATIRQIKAYDAATMIFKNTYGALPGDIKRPNRIPNCNTDDDSICGIAGNGNGRIFELDTNPKRVEEFNFFPHLTKAGMIQGPEGGTQDQKDEIPPSGFWEDNELFFPSFSDVYLNVRYDTFSYDNTRFSNIYYAREINIKTAAALDVKMDDGLMRKGDIIGSDSADLNCTDVGDGMYDLSQSSGGCALYILSGF